MLRNGLALVALVIGLVQGCSTPLVATTDYDHQFNFSAVHGVYILPIDRSSLNMIRISDMQVVRINDALSTELQARGFRVVDERADADLFMTWHLVTEERMDVRSYNSMSYYSCWRCGPSVSDVSVRQYTQGTFIVDMIDPLRNQSVWRSTISSRLRDQPDADAGAERRAEAARAIFVEFPPGPGT